VSRELVIALAVVLILVVPVLVLSRAGRSRRTFGTPAERATFATLHTANLAAPPLREGLTADAAGRAARHLATLLGGAAVAITDDGALLVWEGEAADRHAASAVDLATPVLDDGRPLVVPVGNLSCAEPDCPVRAAVVAPLLVEDTVVGTLTSYAATASPARVRAVGEVARWVSGQLELAELDASRTRLAQADLKALRAQISPHFIYNSLSAIASFVRTDPERARDLIVEFAEFTRYSFRSTGDFTTLADELRAIDRYLLLERARFGDRLSVTLRIAPEVLPVAVPFLCLQPLVENAVQHGLEGPDGGTVTIVAEDAGAEGHIGVEDDGVGMDPERLRRALAGEDRGDSVGLGNVDERMRSVFGAEFGLVVETGPGAGTRVSMRVPKFRAGVRAS
jgi:two-component system, LytTR family, sensor kinase